MRQAFVRLVASCCVCFSEPQSPPRSGRPSSRLGGTSYCPTDGEVEESIETDSANDDYADPRQSDDENSANTGSKLHHFRQHHLSPLPPLVISHSLPSWPRNHRHAHAETSPATPLVPWLTTTSGDAAASPGSLFFPSPSSPGVIHRNALPRERRHSMLPQLPVRGKQDALSILPLPFFCNDGARQRRPPHFVTESDRRREHSSQERKRRDEINSAFEELRMAVPSLCGRPGVHKVKILGHATLLAKELSAQSGNLEREFERELGRQRRLWKALSKLQ
ncbi:protein S-Myc-like isoform X2 [Ixodes scapularis]|uniref:protein S-Myc-like isoform X2 n=1 Tax=Ixodes scapularis TaxID=6945 RepID=UPI001C384251|nr:protein S-Myc-like isoform X2 [Ixodes scapularis]